MMRSQIPRPRALWRRSRRRTPDRQARGAQRSQRAPPTSRRGPRRRPRLVRTPPAACLAERRRRRVRAVAAPARSIRLRSRP
ncbi:MAG: hypothetical protein CO108_06910 [Deltaproteobacteria bacterium CG_4_9_14_3_um_filter_63_12]|nr:MAG: hypothetical protein CO108_06910 [Deltaproteobacteria bacterium CG_4_9_14_3_um_filter_63_12]